MFITKPSFSSIYLPLNSWNTKTTLGPIYSKETASSALPSCRFARSPEEKNTVPSLSLLPNLFPLTRAFSRFSPLKPYFSPLPPEQQGPRYIPRRLIISSLSPLPPCLGRRDVYKRRHHGALAHSASLFCRACFSPDLEGNTFLPREKRRASSSHHLKFSLQLSVVAIMEGEISWDSYNMIHFGGSVLRFEQITEGNDEAEFDTVSLENILPNDILERILSFLPIASVFRAACVCKRWYEIIHSRRRTIWANRVPQKPWYFMFTCNDTADGYAYDPDLRKWYNLKLPCIDKSNWFISSSSGLVCFMDNNTRSRIFVCNPITRAWRKLIEPPGVKSPDYSALAISVDRKFKGYDVVVVKTKQVPEDFHQWELSIHIYESESELWFTWAMEVLVGWRGGDEGVICKGVLYCLIHCTGVVGNSLVRHALRMYDIAGRSSRNTSLKSTSIPAPCLLTCGRLMNLKDNLVLVGGIAKLDRPDIIKGIGIWELHEKQWREVARMPHRYFQGFGEFDDVFASSGSDDLVYIQSYGATTLLVFDMSKRQWRWSQKCPVTKRFPLQLFTGFCFIPKLEVAT